MSLENKYLDWSGVVPLWGEYTSPFRPSEKEILIYSEYIKELGENILLLGATPEIREVLSKFKLKVTLLDSSLDMIKGMFNYGKIDRKNETWINDNWLKIDKVFEKNNFDLILGDLVLRNIDASQQEKFLKKTANVLSSDGLLLLRIHCCDCYCGQDADKVVDEFFNNFSNENKKIAEDLLTSRLFDCFTNKKNKAIDKNKFIDYVNSKLKEEKQDQIEIFNRISSKWCGNDRTWIQRTSDEINKMINKYFKIEYIFAGNDYPDSEFYPIYAIVKK